VKGRGDRHARVAERIREEVSLILQNKVKDPGMGVVTVTDVTVTPDLKTARVHYSVLGGDEERLAVRDALRRSKGFIRKELGRTCSFGTPGSRIPMTIPTRKAPGWTVC
jgi:ribosome-binding factor A